MGCVSVDPSDDNQSINESIIEWALPRPTDDLRRIVLYYSPIESNQSINSPIERESFYISNSSHGNIDVHPYVLCIVLNLVVWGTGGTKGSIMGGATTNTKGPQQQQQLKRKRKANELGLSARSKYLLVSAYLASHNSRDTGTPFGVGVGLFASFRSVR